MAKIAFNLSDRIVVTAPVHIKVPQSANTKAVGKSETRFVTQTVYLDFEVPKQDDLDELAEEIRRQNRELSDKVSEAVDRRRAASTDEERTAIDEEIAAINREVRNAGIEQLKRFVVGLPENHGIGVDGGEAEYSPELIERLCQYEFVRAAMLDALQGLINGGAKRGN